MLFLFNFIYTYKEKKYCNTYICISFENKLNAENRNTNILTILKVTYIGKIKPSKEQKSKYMYIYIIINKETEIFL